MKNLANTRLRPTMPGCLARGKPMDRRHFLLPTIPYCPCLSDFLASSLVCAHDFGRGFRYLKRLAVDSAVEQTLGASIGAAMARPGQPKPQQPVEATLHHMSPRLGTFRASHWMLSSGVGAL